MRGAKPAFYGGARGFYSIEDGGILRFLFWAKDWVSVYSNDWIGQLGGRREVQYFICKFWVRLHPPSIPYLFLVSFILSNSLLLPIHFDAEVLLVCHMSWSHFHTLLDIYPFSTDPFPLALLFPSSPLLSL